MSSPKCREARIKKRERVRAWRIRRRERKEMRQEKKLLKAAKRKNPKGYR